MEIVKDRILNGKKIFVDKHGNLIGQGRRAIKEGSEFNYLIKLSDVKNTSSLTYGNVDDTVNLMADIIKGYHYQVNDLANFLKKGSELETCRSIWNFVFNHIQYKRDRKDREQLSKPARLWLNRSKEGTPSDCDEHSVFVGSLLYCLGIPFKIRIAGYDGKPFSHVYIVTQSDICIDTVLHAFNKEAFYSSKQDSKTMQIEVLHGLGDTEELNGLGAVDALQKCNEVYERKAEDFVGCDDLEQAEDHVLNGVDDSAQREEEALRELAQGHMKVTLDQYEKEPELFHAKGFTPTYWKYFRKAYNSLRQNESLEGIIVNMSDGARWEKSNMNPVNGLENEYGETVGFMGGLEGWFKKAFRKVRHGVRRVGRTVRKVAKKVVKTVSHTVRAVGRTVRKTVKKFSKWAVKMLKKIGKFLMMINPIMVIVRAMLRAKIKSNKRDMAIKMGYGLLSQKQAESIGVSAKDWQEAKRTYAKFAKKYSFFGGRVSKMRSILKKAWYSHTSKKGLKNIKLNGMDDNLGELGLFGSRRRRRRRRARAAASARAAAAAKAAKARSIASSNARITRQNRVDRAWQLKEDKRFRDSQNQYNADKRENAAAEKKLNNRSKWQKEQLAFLKQMFKSEAKMLKGVEVDGLGEPVTLATTGAAAGITAKIIAWVMKMLKKVGLGKVVEKLKKKHIDNLKNKLSTAVQNGASKLVTNALSNKLKKAETNLAVFKTYGTNIDSRKPSEPVVFQTRPEEESIHAKPLVESGTKTKTASMGKMGMLALLLVGGGLLLSNSNKNKGSNSSKTKKK